MPGRLCSREQSSKGWFVRIQSYALKDYWRSSDFSLQEQEGTEMEEDNQFHLMSILAEGPNHAEWWWCHDKVSYKNMLHCDFPECFCRIVPFNHYVLYMKKTLMLSCATYHTFILMVLIDPVLSQTIFKLERIVAANKLYICSLTCRGKAETFCYRIIEVSITNLFSFFSGAFVVR